MKKKLSVPSTKTILITGGAGYIGTHTLVELHTAGYNFVVYDNLSNSSKESLKRVSEIISADVIFTYGDICDFDELIYVFIKHNIDSVIHFAGLKAVGESVSDSLTYYDNNVAGTINLLKVMKAFDCKKIVFSSSATVYGTPSSTPIYENFPVGATTNPYGTSKYMIEQILNDLYISDNSFKIVILRYFNPIGAHESGLIGEDPNGIPNNLMPFISQVAIGKREFLSVFGGDYNTPDGTCIRDYVHVVDLANAHVKAIDYMNAITENFKPLTVNIGTGIGHSVLDVVKAFQLASGQTIRFKLMDRRAGDIEQCYASPQYAKAVLNWEATRDLECMCKTSWNWQSKNPNGYN